MTTTRPAIPLCISEDSGGIICFTRLRVFIAILSRFEQSIDELTGDKEIDGVVPSIKFGNHDDVEGRSPNPKIAVG
jgi:hypothetical protein